MIHGLAIESVTVSVNRSDESVRVVGVAHDRPQVSDHPGEIPIRHKGVRPERGVQFRLRQRLWAAVHENGQEIESFRREMDRLTIAEQLARVAVKSERAEAEWS